MGVFPTGLASGLMGSKSRSNRLAPSWKGPGASNLAAVRKKSSVSIRQIPEIDSTWQLISRTQGADAEGTWWA